MPSKIEPIPDEDLYQMYHVDGMSTYKIAKKIGVSQGTICMWMTLYNIPKRTISESLIGCDINMPTKEDICYMYHVDRMSISQIAKVVGVCHLTICKLMKMYGISARTNSESHIKCDIEMPTKKDLYSMYWDENMSASEIAELVGVHSETILKWMRKCDIPRRTISESCSILDNRGPNNPNWTGGPKTYCYKFDNRLREAVRERDNYACQNCGKTQEDDYRKLSVHHVHYDVENCYPDLISLCQSCHNSSNSNRDWWETHYMCILAERGLFEWKPPWSE